MFYGRILLVYISIGFPFPYFCDGTLTDNIFIIFMISFVIPDYFVIFSCYVCNLCHSICAKTLNVNKGHLTFDSHWATVVPLVGGVRARCVALVLPLVFGSEPLDHQPDLVPRVPLHPHLPALHPALVRGIWETLVPGGHHSHLPSSRIIPVQEPLKVLCTWTFVPWHSTGQGELEPCNAVEGSRGKCYVTTHSVLEHCERKMERQIANIWDEWAGKIGNSNSVTLCGSQCCLAACLVHGLTDQYSELMAG